MSNYRTYLLDAADRISDLVEGEYEDDANALRAALRARGEYAAVEVWRETVLVGRVGVNFEPFEIADAGRASP